MPSSEASLCNKCQRLSDYYKRYGERDERESDKWSELRQPCAETTPEKCDLCRLISESIIAFRDIGHRPELQGSNWRLPENVMYKRHHLLKVGYTQSETEDVDCYGTEKRTVDLNLWERMFGESYTLSDREFDKGNIRNYVSNDEQLDALKLLLNDHKPVGSAKLEVTTPPNQTLPWHGFNGATEIASSSSNGKSFDRIKEWLKNCSRDHRGCVAEAVAKSDLPNPKRLIDTGPSDEEPALKLIDSPIGKVKYCALSYCWGKDAAVNYMTTKDTIEARRNGIPFRELPRTFRDAIEITRKVECRYLWIDAICIIQHDREDWEFESRRMHSIYGNAFLVIAATHSASPSTGIFTDRSPTARFEFDCAGKTYKISVKETSDHSGWRSLEGKSSEDQNSPLHSRAWAFQERLLATRVIHYSSSELIWECKTCIRCECSNVERYSTWRDFKPGSSLKTEFAGRYMTEEKKLDNWQSIISEYTARNLTIADDRLPALSGLARHFASPKLGRYLAGIWESNLPDALDWSIVNARKPEGYRAPSWCWSSLEGQVTCITYGGARGVELLEVDCTLAGDNPYGMVSDGYIVVKGQFGPIEAGWYNSDDYDIPGSTNDEVWALKMKSSDFHIWHSLLLKKSKRVAGAWERVGYGIAHDRCFEGRGRSVVRII